MYVCVHTSAECEKSDSGVKVLTVETAPGSSGTATLEAAAVDYGSAACSRENVRSASESLCVCLCVCLSVRVCVRMPSHGLGMGPVVDLAAAMGYCVSAALDVK